MRKKILIVCMLLSLGISGITFFVNAEEKIIIDDSKELFKQVQLFADAITLISKEYVKPIEVKDLIYGAIKGMMGTLDGYSQFLDPDSFRDITEETKGEFGGIGIEIGMREGVLTVIAPIEDTPAFKAGLQADDKIVKIDDEITREMTLDDAVKKLRGEPGTDVKITVIREGADKLLDFTLTRAIIKLESIKESKIIEEDIAYIKLVEFQERTARDLRQEIKNLKAEGAKSLIIDLRNNPGGLLNSSIDVADQFLEPGALIVYTEGRDPKKRVDYTAKRKTDFHDMNMAVLVNKGSASASEILAGAIKDNKRGIIIGTPTFGKGSVQTVMPLKDRSALRLTTAAYYTPSGKNISDKGIEPDIVVERKKTEEKEEDSEKEKIEEKKKELFRKVKKDKKDDEQEEKEKTEEKKEIYDNQLRTAVNVLKGINIFEGYKTQVVEVEVEEKVAE